MRRINDPFRRLKSLLLPPNEAAIQRPISFAHAHAMTNANLFQEFPPVSKADWLRQITKDLKDKPLEDFVWQASEGLALSPFVHAEDFETPPVPLSEQPNAWEICEDVWVMDPVASNRQSMDALEGWIVTAPAG